MITRAIYNICELAAYCPCVLGSVAVSRRHQDVTKSAWTSLVLLCVTRIVAAATSIANSYEPSRGLRLAATVMDPIGLVALLYTPMILLTRVNATMWQQRAPQRYFWLTIFPLIIAFVVGLIGSLNTNSTTQDNIPKGWVRLQVSGTFFLVVVIVLIAVTAFNMLRYSHVPRSEVRLLYSVAIGITASFCPTMFALAAASVKQTRYFWYPNSDLGIFLSAALMTAPEVLALVVYLWAGFTVRLAITAPPIEKEESPPACVEPASQVSNALDFHKALTSPTLLSTPKISK